MATVQADAATELLRADDGRDNDALTTKLFWIFLIAHVTIWWVICLITQPNMPLDMVEMLYWGQQWQWGYHKHPPLPAWTAAAMWEFGGHHPWAMYLTSQLTIATTFWAVWKLARTTLTPKLALCSVVVMEGCYYCSLMINDINNTIMTRPMWALTILFMYQALTKSTPRQRTLNWCLTGVCIGLGMLCKYYIGVLVLALMTVPIFIPQTRRALRTPGPYLMTAIASLIFLPHALWVIDNDFITILYVLNRSSDAAAAASTAAMVPWLSHVTSPVSFLLSQVIAVVPVVLLLLPLVTAWKLGYKKSTPTDAQKNHAITPSLSFFNQYILIAVGGPILIYVVLAAVTGAAIRSMWGGPLFSFLGLAIIANVQIELTAENYRKVLRGSLCAGCLMAVALFSRNAFGPAVRGELSKVHFPGQAVAAKVNLRWNQYHKRPLEIVGGQMFVSGCVSVYSDHPVTVYGGMKPEANPWVNDKQLKEQGGMIVWDTSDEGSEIPPAWRARFPNAEVLETIRCQSAALTGTVDAEVGVAIVHPQNTNVAEGTLDTMMR